MSRTSHLLAPLCLSSLLLAACGGISASNENSAGSGGAEMGFSGHAGAGGSAGSGASGGAGVSDGTGCITTGAAACALPASVVQAVLTQLDIPGVGRVWPRPAQLAGRDGGAEIGGGDGGVNGTGAQVSGCVTVFDPSSTDPAVTCHGLATLAWLGEEQAALEITYGDGSVARVSADESPGVAEAELDVSVSTYWNPDEGSRPWQTVSGRTKNGAELWIQQYHWTLEDAALFFGANLTEVESCPLGHVLDQIVHTVPEQRISAGKIATVRAALGTYRVAWSRSRPEPTACDPNPYQLNDFTAALVGSGVTAQ